MNKSVPIPVLALLGCLLGCSTPLPVPLTEAEVAAAIEPGPTPSPPPQLAATGTPAMYYVDPYVINPDPKDLPAPRFCYVGTSCMDLDTQPFRACRLGEDCPKDAELLKAGKPEPDDK